MPFSIFKNMDPHSRAYFFRIFMGCLGIFIILGVVLAFAKSFPPGFILYWTLVSLVGSVFLSSIAFLALQGLGKGAGALFADGRSTASLRERLTADMDSVRHLKMRKDFGAALSKVNQILAQDPDYPEALFLKAQVLWEGYRNEGQARMCLRKAMLREPDETQAIHRWASDLYDEITGKKPPKEKTIWDP